ncbi:molybdate ABC transporter substrate-binding protein [Chromobacterium violaceum]|uniref:Molybdate-binding periplasmic protein n=1 Tax=Chromobacterium violaceum (strain ATCC 12472 / DSM 30191 / JCM 1249 / CCUG 213 / NBRC 12614 / NCIMB 9131 / NCTC 9757 / MK) TaxID=243365 RepID=Q7NRQ4_CHRVO|nr:molybdate ABC transporter substrate-binding protein [Chromobacterium violaceum]AAQ61388.1 molybdate-binding periplasmic protein precursor [Chromobacterium violaceum ATCC 12472]MBA8734627.1 molybdate ABC transporter substrate-binding protein [Chromobacterium violaceum]OQS29765.1 molybdate ABC transporter substrate-binding protein [Chromobacterium violaceum]QIY80185.1 molybdate ABC transporter substrate-binding protein [Chromobacterium violaceum]SUX88428.1 Molybdate-binding periplasmic protei
MPRLRLALLCLILSPLALADTVNVAVASNFQQTLDKIAKSFKAATGHDVKASAGASGKLAAQIRQGAPFEVFLSADDERPTELAKAGLGQASSQFTYAYGQLALWSKQRDDAGEAALRKGDFAKLAVANPATAPYGRAALETLAALKLEAAVKPKLLTGDNIGQTMQFAEVGGADFAFVAYSQLLEQGIRGHYWLVPEKLHQPIRQDALLIKPTPAAAALMAYLKGEQARALMAQAGYRFKP